MPSYLQEDQMLGRRNHGMRNINRKVSAKSIFVWNIVGSMTRAGSSVILLLIVTRICGTSDGGVFSIAYATAQMLLTIGWYGMRAYQVTDVRSRFQFSTYLSSRVITCLIMLLGGGIYIAVSRYSAEKAWVVFFICVLKMVDAVEDVYHGLLQQHGRLDLAGILLTVRNVFSMFSFFVVLLATRNLLITSAIVSIVSLFFCLLLNIPFANQLERSTFNFSFLPLKKLFIDCFPLCAGNFLSIYIYNAPKYAIDNSLSADFQAYYNIIFMPAFVINLFSEVVFKPLLVKLASLWIDGDVKQFFSMIFRLIVWIILLTVIAVISAYFIGIPVLSILYGVDLSGFKLELLILLSGGGFGACAWLLNNVLTAMRKQKILLLGYSLVAIFAGILSPVLVSKLHFRGAALSYFWSILLLSGFFMASLLFYKLRNRKNEEEQI